MFTKKSRYSYNVSAPEIEGSVRAGLGTAAWGCTRRDLRGRHDGAHPPQAGHG
jgi:hypothetical protein